MESCRDTPSDLLPSSNFANQPTSDISMLETVAPGVWTITLPYSTVVDQDEHAEYNLPSQTRHPATVSPSLQLQSTLSIKSTFLVEEPSEDGVRIMDRPRFTTRPRTAPQGSYRSQEESQSNPRQTAQIRIVDSNITKLKGSQLEKIFEDTLGSKGSIYIQRMETEDLKSLSKLNKSENSTEIKEPPRLLRSVLQNEWCNGAVDAKGAEGPNTTTLDIQSRNSPKLTNSLPASPIELVKELDLSVKGPESAPPTSLRTLSPSAEHNVQGRDTPREKDDAEDSEAAGQRRLYVPGPIRLEPENPPVRRDSAASLEQFVPDVTSKDYHFSDLVGLDSIVMFFEDFGVVEEVTASSFDQYWLRGNQIYDHGDNGDNGSKRDDISVEKPTSKGHERTLRAPVSILSFSPSSPTSSMSPSETTMRQRIRLRKWLSPAFPGSTILKSSTALV